MQEEAKNEKDQPMVDIDTSGPGADVELEEQKPEGEIETKEEDSSPAPQAEEPREEKAEGSDAQPEAEKKQEVKPEQKKEELETYSKDVQRRIAKLTKKWREAERQKDEALSFAKKPSWESHLYSPVKVSLSKIWFILNYTGIYIRFFVVLNRTLTHEMGK